MRVLHVAETIRGGIATYFSELHPYQIACFGRRNVHYVVPEGHRHDLDGIDSENISCFHRSGRNIASLARMASQTLAQIRRHRPDVVHLHSTFAGLVIRPLLLFIRLRPRVVYCPHGWSFTREASLLSRSAAKAVEWLLANITDRIICISHYEYGVALDAGINANRLSLVRNGINSARPAPVKPGTVIPWNASRTRILFVGRFDRQKGYDILIEAARQLGDQFEVRMIGSPVLDKQKALGPPPNVRLLGWMDHRQIEAQLDQADIAVIPSRWEAFGLVALEAMRASKAIVAFRVGALAEIVEHGVTGILCEPISAEALIGGLRATRELDLTLAGQRARARFFELFTADRMHTVLTQVYWQQRPSAEHPEPRWRSCREPHAASHHYAPSLYRGLRRLFKRVRLIVGCKLSRERSSYPKKVVSAKKLQLALRRAANGGSSRSRSTRSIGK